LRKRIQSIRDNIPKDEKERLDAAIAAHLISWEAYRSSKALFCFVSFRSEINTRPILEKSIQLDKTVSVPKINLASGEMRAFIIDDFESCLEPGEYGILEPVSSCRELDYSHLDLIITPGLAFTSRGERLGYGGGFYDRFIERHFQATICALVYDRLVLNEIPVKEHDVPVDYLITESGVKAVLRGDR
jgi:5-formyltetrahydrofolate cyclo-ligase